MRHRMWLAATLLAGAVVLAIGCVHTPPPQLPTAPPDVQGLVWAIHGSFEGGGEIVVRRQPTPDSAMPLPLHIQLRPGAAILLRRGEKLDHGNFSTIQLGQRLSAWWDGEPTRDSAGVATGPVRMVVVVFK
ncbi:MAG TPA: hypothetical protein VF832_00845 [Longimicrobiales bacterium]